MSSASGCAPSSFAGTQVRPPRLPQPCCAAAPSIPPATLPLHSHCTDQHSKPCLVPADGSITPAPTPLPALIPPPCLCPRLLFSADKFQAKFGRRLAPADRERVLARVNAVSQALTALNAAVQQQREQG